MGRAGRPGEVRLPRPQDADGAADRGRAGDAGAASRSISPRSRSTTRRPTSCWRARETVGVFQLESAGMRRALLDMRPDRFEDIIALVALYRPGPMANIPTYCARKHGMEKPDYIHPKLEADPEGDLRRHHLSGAGDAGRADPGRLHARPGRPPAPRHGQEDQKGDAGAARHFRRGRGRRAASSATRPTRSSICSSASPNTASTRAMPRPTRWSPTRPPT